MKSSTSATDRSVRDLDGVLMEAVNPMNGAEASDASPRGGDQAIRTVRTPALLSKP